MSRNGSGGYSLPVNTWNPATTGVSATVTDWQALINDIATAMQQSVSSDGQTAMTGNLAMGNNKLTGLSAGTATGHSLRWEQLFSQGTIANLASATTTDIGAQNTSFLNITGTTTIAGFGSNFNGPRYLVFAGILTLTHSATLVCPGAANITTAANDSAIAIPISGGWQIVAYQKSSGLPVSIAGLSPRATRIDIASVAGTVDLTTNAPLTDDIRITGALAITAFTVAIGRVLRVTASGAHTLTNNANIVTNTGANIVCAAGDSYMLRATAANTVEVIGFVAAASLVTPLPLSRGGTGSAVTRQLAQTSTATRTTVGTGTTQIPGDDTIPQITEGDEYLTISFTPTSASSTLKIRASCTATHSVAGVGLVLAIFQDAIANALAVDWATTPQINYCVPLNAYHEMTAGTTSAITFRLRLGGNAAGTTTVNGATGARFYGGVGLLRITVDEYLP